MMHKERIWDIKEYNSQKADYLAEELNISPMVTGILLERGLQDAASMRDFLYGSAAPFHDPFLLKDMQRSVERIERALVVRFTATMMWTESVLPPCCTCI